MSISPPKEIQMMVNEITDALHGMYGSRFHLTSDVRRGWSESLKALSLVDLKKGLEKLYEGNHNFVEWPPSALQFKQLCKDSIKMDDKEFYKSTLPDTKVTNVGLQSINDIRKMLGMSAKAV